MTVVVLEHIFRINEWYRALGGLIEKSYPLVTAVLFAFPICFTTKDTKDTKSTKRLDNEALDPVL